MVSIRPIIVATSAAIMGLHGVLPNKDSKGDQSCSPLRLHALLLAVWKREKQFCMHRRDAEWIKAAAAARDLKEADFIRQAALLHARKMELHMSLTMLPIETLEAFRCAVEAPGKVVLDLAATAGSPATWSPQPFRCGRGAAPSPDQAAAKGMGIIYLT